MHHWVHDGIDAPGGKQQQRGTIAPAADASRRVPKSDPSAEAPGALEVLS
jgi:hypothetical protein